MLVLVMIPVFRGAFLVLVLASLFILGLLVSTRGVLMSSGIRRVSGRG
jgi:hypothetical protein